MGTYIFFPLSRFTPHHHLRFHYFLEALQVFHCLEKIMRTFDHTSPVVVFQSSAAAPSSLPAAVGRCSVSRCPGNVTAGRRVKTRVMNWNVPVSVPHFCPFIPNMLHNTNNPWLIKLNNNNTKDVLMCGWSSLGWGPLDYRFQCNCSALRLYQDLIDMFSATKINLSDLEVLCEYNFDTDWAAAGEKSWIF